MSEHLASKRPDIPPAQPASDANGARRSPAQALVAVFIDSAQSLADARNDEAHWRLTNPLADWVSIDVREMPKLSDAFWLQRKLSEPLDRSHMHFGQLVLLGRGDAGRLALDLVLNGALSCAGIVGIDIPCAPLRTTIAHTSASVRLVLHKGSVNRPDGLRLINGLRRQDVDTRVMMLPSVVGPGGAEATARAAGTFLFELVANACLHANHQGKSRHVQSRI
jgi:hypothetical protein